MYISFIILVIIVYNVNNDRKVYIHNPAYVVHMAKKPEVPLEAHGKAHFVLDAGDSDHPAFMAFIWGEY
jgi:hypothetical protein